MNWQEAEQLAERIRVEAPKPIKVVGVEPLGVTRQPSSAIEYFVKCVCKISGVTFAIKSIEHWDDFKHHSLMRLCRFIWRLIVS